MTRKALAAKYATEDRICESLGVKSWVDREANGSQFHDELAELRDLASRHDGDTRKAIESRIRRVWRIRRVSMKLYWHGG